MTGGGTQAHFYIQLIYKATLSFTPNLSGSQFLGKNHKIDMYHETFSCECYNNYIFILPIKSTLDSKIATHALYSLILYFSRPHCLIKEGKHIFEF